jgi:hypothetical protein
MSTNIKVKVTNSQNITEKNPKWVQGKRFKNPKTGDNLLSFQCGYGIKTFIAGYRLATNDPAGNILTVNWKHNGEYVEHPPDVLPSKGTIHCKDGGILINENSPADAGSQITIVCEDDGSDGFWYEVALCVLEEVA